ncbi:DJ-1/PfpI family protein [Kitasatospora sp. NPDC059571]|uniref:DJ-1/PfpI family protein n=1 Tax=Kitasatospora sp. NPDC059571 TaxID=3346871 RepID=UPI003684C591
MQIAVLLYDRFTALDAVGPYEVLSRLPGAEVVFTAVQAGPVRTETGFLSLVAEASTAEVPAPDVLVVPGGPGQPAASADPELLRWLREVDAGTVWTASVCTGSLLLADAGLLAGRRATSHWLGLDRLPAGGAVPVAERVVTDGRYVTAAGVSAGIDLGLWLAARLAGERTAQAIQLGIEYDPAPLFDAGSPASAPPELVAALRARRAELLGA